MQNKRLIPLIILVLISSVSMGFSQNKEEKLYTVQETRLNVMKSVLLPGWGEHSLGYKKRGYFFNSTELLGWLSYAAFTLYSTQSREDMKAFATDHAGITPAGKDNQFYTDIGNYMNIHAYNDQKRRYRQIDRIYTEDEMFWAWDSEKNKQKFDDMRLNSRLAKRNASLVVSTLILNRLLSVIDIATLTKNKVDNPYSNDLEAMIIPERDKTTMTISFRF